MLRILIKYRALTLLSIFRGGAKIGRSIAIIVAFVALTFTMVSLCTGIYVAVRANPEHGGRIMETLISLVFHGIFILLSFTGLSLAIFTIYFGKDLELLFSLPIKSSTIFLYKFIESVILNARMSFLFLAPAIVLLGIYYRASILYYPAAIIITVFIASIPGSLGIIISSLFVRKVSRVRMKNVMTVIGSLLGLGIWAGINLMLNTFESKAAKTISPGLPAFGIISSPVFAYLPSGWASRAAISAAAGNWQSCILPSFLLATCSAVLSYIAMGVTAHHYRSGIVDEPSEASKIIAVRSRVGGSPLLAHLKRDIVILYREPTVTMQILPTILLVFLFPYFTGSLRPGGFGNLSVSHAVAIFALMFGSQLGSRLIPMERLGFCWNLMIPGGNRLMLTGKFILGLSIISVFTILVGLAHLATHIASDIGYIILLTSFSFIGFGFGLPISIVYGNFAWEHPKQMLKGRGVFFMIVSIIIAGMALYIFVSLIGRFISPLITLPALSVVILIIAMAYSSTKLANLEWTS